MAPKPIREPRRGSGMNIFISHTVPAALQSLNPNSLPLIIRGSAGRRKGICSSRGASRGWATLGGQTRIRGSAEGTPSVRCCPAAPAEAARLELASICWRVSPFCPRGEQEAAARRYPCTLIHRPGSFFSTWQFTV